MPEASMHLSLGIDTGGTYTDAALVNQASGEVLTAAKALTTRYDLSIGIREAITTAVKQRPKELLVKAIHLVALSTTLATNAIAEGHGGSVCLVLIGYDKKYMMNYYSKKGSVAKNVVYLIGGHDVKGNEVSSLDEQAAREVILSKRSKVDAFAISGYFSVRNPTHENRLRTLVKDLTDLPVTCGHELTARLDAVGRATTVAYNARLIPLLQNLIANVRLTLNELKITAPLMVVKGDGSLVRAKWAINRPVETILSGPAASTVGAWYLAGRRDTWVVDMGGTTTDIAVLRHGRPHINREGARVGNRRLMVEAVDVHTVGLGGDSHVRLDREGQVLIGPRRAVPICFLASECSEVEEELRRQTRYSKKSGEEQFVIFCRMPSNDLSDDDIELLNQLKTGPQSLRMLSSEAHDDLLLSRRVKRLEGMGAVQRAGFTPTDALHVLGLFQNWNKRASQLAAELIGIRLGLTPENFCKGVIRKISEEVARELVAKIFEDCTGAPEWEKEPTASTLLDWALGGAHDGELGCELTLRKSLVVLGAPVEAYMPLTAQLLHTKHLIPPHAQVANAVGAVAGGVVQRMQVLISPLDGHGLFRVHLPDGIHDFEDLEEAVHYAEDVMSTRTEALAHQAGAGQVEVQMVRTDRRVNLDSGFSKELYLGTELIFTAVGRPSMVI